MPFQDPDVFLKVKARIDAQRAQMNSDRDAVANIRGQEIGPHGVMFAKAYEDQTLIMFHKRYPACQVFVPRTAVHQDPRANYYPGWGGKPWLKYELDVCIAKIDYRFIVARAFVMDRIYDEADKVRLELGLPVRATAIDHERVVYSEPIKHTNGLIYRPERKTFPKLEPVVIEGTPVWHE